MWAEGDGSYRRIRFTPRATLHARGGDRQGRGTYQASIRTSDGGSIDGGSTDGGSGVGGIDSGSSIDVGSTYGSSTDGGSTDGGGSTEGTISLCRGRRMKNTRNCLCEQLEKSAMSPRLPPCQALWHCGQPHALAHALAESHVRITTHPCEYPYADSQKR